MNQSTRPMPIRLHHEIIFGIDGNDTAFLGEGWASAELGRRWTLGEASEIFLSHPGRTDLLLQIDGFPLIVSPIIETQRIVVILNGVEAGIIELPDSRRRALYIPRSRVPDGSTLNLRLELPDAARPAGLGKSSDSRELAVCFSRISLFTLAPAPAAYRPGTGGLALRDFRARTGLSPAAALGCFEGLGDTCEFALVQRRGGAEPPGLLLFATISLQHMLRALDTGFAGMGEPGSYDIRPQPGSRPEYHVLDRHYGLDLRSFRYADETSADAIIDQQGTRLRNLRHDLMKTILAAEKIFVIRRSPSRPKLTEQEVLPVLIALNRHGPCRVLWVTAEGDQPPGTVEQTIPGLLLGRLDRLATDSNLNDFSFDVWLEICANALSIALGTEPQELLTMANESAGPWSPAPEPERKQPGLLARLRWRLGRREEADPPPPPARSVQPPPDLPEPETVEEYAQALPASHQVLAEIEPEPSAPSGAAAQISATVEPEPAVLATPFSQDPVSRPEGEHVAPGAGAEGEKMPEPDATSAPSPVEDHAAAWAEPEPAMVGPQAESLEPRLVEMPFRAGGGSEVAELERDPETAAPAAAMHAAAMHAAAEIEMAPAPAEKQSVGNPAPESPRAAPGGDVYKILQSVTFGNDGNEAEILGAGWSGPEPGFRWTEGGSCELWLDHPGRRNVVVEMDAWPFAFAPHLPVQRVRVSAHETSLAELAFTGPCRKALLVPATAMRPGRILRLRCALPNASRPCDFPGLGDDDRQLAVAFKRLKVYAVPDTEAVQRTGTGGIDASDLLARTGMGAAELVSHFECLGESEAFADVQSAAGAEPAGLLRRAKMRLDRLIEGIEGGFPALGNPTTLRHGRTNDQPAIYTIFDDVTTLFYETGQTVDEVDAEALVAQEARQLRFLRDQFLDDAASGAKIFVYNGAPDGEAVTETEMLPLLMALRQRGPCTLLYTSTADEAHTPGTVQQEFPHLLQGFTDRPAWDDQATERGQKIWLEICANAWALKLAME